MKGLYAMLKNLTMEDEEPLKSFKAEAEESPSLL